METFKRLLEVLGTPIAILNVLGGIISGVWLVILGEWSLIGYGILNMIFGALIIPLAMVLGLFFDTRLVRELEEGNEFKAYIFGFLTTLYTIGVFTIWCIFVLAFFYEKAYSNSIIPILIWSYGVALAPITFMAQKENNEYGMITTFFLEIAYVMAIMGILFMGSSLLNVVIIFGITMFIGMLYQFSIVAKSLMPQNDSVSDL